MEKKLENTMLYIASKTKLEWSKISNKPEAILDKASNLIQECRVDEAIELLTKKEEG